MWQACPTVKQGSYSPFMCPRHTLVHPPTISCATHCCEADHFLGDFLPGPIGRLSGNTVDSFYQSNTGCIIHTYNPFTALNCLALSHNVRRIILVGDSVIRQLFVRFVSYIRRQHSTLDYSLWSDAR